MIENIDIGGPTMIRAAAKNYAFAAPVVSPESYDAVLDELRELDRRLSLPTRESLAAEAFAYTARYDTAIARWFQEKREDFPPLIVRAFEKVLELPYGENPHQRAAYYAQVGARTHVLSMVSQLGGKELSFNNLLDLDAGRLLLGEFQIPACVIIKHNNPCGVAVGTTALEAYQRAFACDPMSAFGGVVCLNRRVDRELAEALHEQFVEVLFARGYDEDALEVLVRPSRNMRILDDRERRTAEHDRARTCARSSAAMLVQDRDYRPRGARRDAGRLRARARPRPSGSELSFAWKVCKHVRSNAIVLCARPRHDRDRRRPDEPGRLGPPGDREGPRPASRARCWPPTPTSRSPTARSSRSTAGVDRDHPAGRLGPRSPRWSRRSTRAGARDGVHQPPPLPPLIRGLGCAGPRPAHGLWRSSPRICQLQRQSPPARPPIAWYAIMADTPP